MHNLQFSGIFYNNNLLVHIFMHTLPFIAPKFSEPQIINIQYSVARRMNLKTADFAGRTQTYIRRMVLHKIHLQYIIHIAG